MADTGALDSATKRLTLALDSLEAAVEYRRELDQNGQSLGTQLHVIGTDRARLVAELDQVAARSREIEGTNREVARRIDVAMDGIRALIDVNGG